MVHMYRLTGLHQLSGRLLLVLFLLGPTLEMSVCCSVCVGFRVYFCVCVFALDLFLLGPTLEMLVGCSVCVVVCVYFCVCVCVLVLFLLGPTLDVLVCGCVCGCLCLFLYFFLGVLFIVGFVFPGAYVGNVGTLQCVRVCVVVCVC